MKKNVFLFFLLVFIFFSKAVQATTSADDTLTKAEYNRVAMFGFHTYGGIYLGDSVTVLAYFNGTWGKGYVYDWRGFALFDFQGSYQVADKMWVMTATNGREKGLGELRAEITTQSMNGFTLMFNSDKFNWKATPKLAPLPTVINIAGLYSPAGSDEEDPDSMLDFGLVALAFDEKKDGVFATVCNTEITTRFSPFIAQHGPYGQVADVKNQMLLVQKHFLNLYFQGVDSSLSLSKLLDMGVVHYGYYSAKTELLYAQHDLISLELNYHWRMDTTLNQNYARDGSVYQVSTGKKLTLNDLFLPGFEEKLRALAEKNKDANFMEGEAVTLSTDFSIDGFGLHLYYSQGSTGNWQTQCYIPWKALEPLINPDGPLAFVVK